MGKFSKDGTVYECIQVSKGEKITLKDYGKEKKDYRIPAGDWLVSGPDDEAFAVRNEDFQSSFKLV